MMKPISIRKFLFQWIVIEIVILIVVAAISLTNLRNDFADDRSRLAIELTDQYSQRLASVRLLELVLQLPDGDTEPSFIQVAAGIMKTYPFCDRIQLYEIRAGQSELTETISVPSPIGKPAGADMPAIMRAVALQSEGETIAYEMPHFVEHILFATKVMNGRTPAAIVVAYDMAKAIQALSLPEGIELQVRLGDTPVYVRNRHTHGLFTGYMSWFAADFPRAPLNPDDDDSQAHVHFDKHIAFGDVFDWRMIVPLSIFGFAALYAFYLLMNQRAALAEAQEAEQSTRRQMDSLRHENRLFQALRVNAVGELASGIAHELAQPLTALLSQSQAGLILLEKEKIWNKEGGLKQALVANVREAQRAGNILHRMRDYIVGNDIQPALQELNPTVVNMVELMRAKLKEQDIEVSMDFATPSPKSIVGAIELEQVIHNLLRNAIDALSECTHDRKRIAIRTFNQGAINLIEIADNGPGMSDEVLKNLFHPFFTTKENGMGLGLSLCARLLERSGGTLHARNDNGAVFWITVPGEG